MAGKSLAAAAKKAKAKTESHKRVTFDDRQVSPQSLAESAVAPPPPSTKEKDPAPAAPKNAVATAPTGSAKQPETKKAPAAKKKPANTNVEEVKQVEKLLLDVPMKRSCIVVLSGMSLADYTDIEARRDMELLEEANRVVDKRFLSGRSSNSAVSAASFRNLSSYRFGNKAIAGDAVADEVISAADYRTKIVDDDSWSDNDAKANKDADANNEEPPNHELFLDLSRDRSRDLSNDLSNDRPHDSNCAVSLSDEDPSFATANDVSHQISSAMRESYVIPSRFVSHETWPRASPLKCWQCDMYFRGPPLFIPRRIVDTPAPIDMSISEIEKRKHLGESLTVSNNIMSVEAEGNMCSFACARRWIDERSSSIRDRQQRISVLIGAYHIYYGKRVVDIPAAPSKLERIEYGGSLDANTFRNIINSLQ